MGASQATGLGSAKAPEPHSGLGPTGAIPCAETRLTAHVWSGHFTKREGDPERCRAAVAEGGRSPMFHQCRRKPTVFRDCAEPVGRFGFCGVHDPLVVMEKRAAREAQWRKEWDARDAMEKRRRNRDRAEKRCVEVLREIADGHNDPRAIAREALDALDAIAIEAATAGETA